METVRISIKSLRKKILYGKIREDVREIIMTLCKYKDVEIIAGAVCMDRVHLSVAILPKISISYLLPLYGVKSMISETSMVTADDSCTTRSFTIVGTERQQYAARDGYFHKGGIHVTESISMLLLAEVLKVV